MSPVPSKPDDPSLDAIERALLEFRRHGGMLRSCDAIDQGIHSRTLSILRDRGAIEPIARGYYRLTDLQPLAQPDLVTVALVAPHAVICLISALHFHGLTTQIPRLVDIALPRGRRSPALAFPPVRPHWLKGPALREGVETHVIDGVPVRIFSAEKSIADAFKFRGAIGTDVAAEALRMYRARRKRNLPALQRFARICRVERVMAPYLEALS
jgi:predicted transcriptional regulator of viral defense system